MTWETYVSWAMSVLSVQTLSVVTTAIAAVALCLCGASAIRGRVIFATLFAGLGIANGLATMTLHRMDGNGTPRNFTLIERGTPYEILGEGEPRYDQHHKTMIVTLRNTRTGQIQDWNASIKTPESGVRMDFQIHPVTGVRTVTVFSSPSKTP